MSNQADQQGPSSNLRENMKRNGSHRSLGYPNLLEDAADDQGDVIYEGVSMSRSDSRRNLRVDGASRQGSRRDLMMNNESRKNGSRRDLISQNDSQKRSRRNLMRDGESRNGSRRNLMVEGESRNGSRRNLMVDRSSRHGSRRNLMVDSNARQRSGRNLMVDSNARQGSRRNLMVESNARQGSGRNLMVDSNARQGSRRNLMVESNARQGSGRNLMVDSNGRQGSRRNLMMDSHGCSGSQNGSRRNLIVDEEGPMPRRGSRNSLASVDEVDAEGRPMSRRGSRESFISVDELQIEETSMMYVDMVPDEGSTKPRRGSRSSLKLDEESPMPRRGSRNSLSSEGRPRPRRGSRNSLSSEGRPRPRRGSRNSLVLDGETPMPRRGSRNSLVLDDETPMPRRGSRNSLVLDDETPIEGRSLPRQGSRASLLGDDEMTKEDPLMPRRGSRSSLEIDEELPVAEAVLVEEDFDKASGAVAISRDAPLISELMRLSKKQNWKKKLLSAVLMLIAIYIIIDLIFLGNVQNLVNDFLDWVARYPAPGVFVFIGIMILGTLFFIPLGPLMFAAGFTFAWAVNNNALAGTAVGFIVCYIGLNIGAILSFLRSRYMSRDVFELLASRYPVVKAADRALESKGFRVFTLLRMCPLIPFGCLNYIGGVMSLSAEQFVKATLIGIIPNTLFWVFIGASADTLANRKVENGSGKQTALRVLLSLGIAFGVIGMILVWRKSMKELKKMIVESDSAKNYFQYQKKPSRRFGTIVYHVDARYGGTTDDDDSVLLEEGGIQSDEPSIVSAPDQDSPTDAPADQEEMFSLAPTPNGRQYHSNAFLYWLGSCGMDAHLESDDELEID